MSKIFFQLINYKWEHGQTAIFMHGTILFQGFHEIFEENWILWNYVTEVKPYDLSYGKSLFGGGCGTIKMVLSKPYQQDCLL